MPDIYVTKPFLPLFEEYITELKNIWKSKYLTNNGPYVQELERQLCKYLQVDYISLFNNGTSALFAALKMTKFVGDIITTPFSFIATTHAAKLCGHKIIFADIDPCTGCLDPDKVEKYITQKTTAILPVQIYGNNCNFERFEELSNDYDIDIIYDAAHAFGCNESYNYGTFSILSFHATKVFTTIEGGAVICHDKYMKEELDRIRNFGILEEGVDLDIGFNGKMNELQAALGLLQLKYINKIIERRQEITEYYNDNLKNIKKIESKNYSYYPILTSNRDLVYNKLKENHIYARKYFYPLISNTPQYCRIKSGSPINIPIANLISNNVLCLPIYPELTYKEQDRIIKIVEKYA